MSDHGDDGASTRGSARAVWSDFCAVQMSPDLKERIKAELQRARTRGRSPLAFALGMARPTRPLGFDDGVIIPPDRFPVGTSYGRIRAMAAERAPLRGTVRVVVVLVQFSDRAMGQPASHFQELFFSTGVLPNGSVTEYFNEVTGGLVVIDGEVVGPYTLPQNLAWYANNNFGIGRPSGTPRANIMANDSAVAADPDVDFGLYDNDGNGFVDAFIVVHAGGGGEQTGNPNDIWSHKWVLPSALTADSKQIFAYLTIPEDARIGVCAHELGHLLFGFPDLYDTDDTSEGIGNWCLMAGGSWNGGGDIPAHPSAWCKAQQGWAAVTNVVTGGTLSLPDVKSSRTIHRLWKDGTGGSEYFLLENRQRTGYDSNLPGDGLLIWHIDDAQGGNTDENHYRVALMQADGKRDMELDVNRGDAGDPYPGTSGNTSFTGTSTPSSKSYASQDTCVSVTAISASGPTMTATVQVQCGKALAKDSKDTKDIKDIRKETKELSKERKDLKDVVKEFKERKDQKEKELWKETKELAKDRKDLKDRVETKQLVKDLRDEGGGGKGPKELVEWPGGFGEGGLASEAGHGIADLEERIAILEAAMGLGGQGEAFIGPQLRPDLMGAPDYSGLGDLQSRMAAGDRDAKLAFDSPPPR